MALQLLALADSDDLNRIIDGDVTTVNIDDILAHDFPAPINDGLRPDQITTIELAFDRKAAHVNFAREQIAEVTEQNGVPVWRLSKGSLIAEWPLLGNIVEDILQALRDASPVVSGAYRDGHGLYINGARQETIPKVFDPADKIMIANPVPYVRRIELGVTKAGRAFVIQVPPRIYRRVTGQMQNRFGNQAKIRLDEGGVVLPDAVTIKGASGRAGVSARYQKGNRFVNRRLHRGEVVKSPAMYIEMF